MVVAPSCAIHGFAGPGRPSPEAVDRDGNRTLVRAARGASVERFVLLSVYGASADHPMSLHRAKHAAEEELRASGVAYTIVRPTAPTSVDDVLRSYSAASL